MGMQVQCVVLNDKSDDMYDVEELEDYRKHLDATGYLSDSYTPLNVTVMIDQE